MKTESKWIDAAILRDFEAEGTDAHRLCTIEDGWVERFGRDVLGSFLAKTKNANLRVSYSAIQPRICRQSPASDISSLGSTSGRAIPWASLSIKEKTGAMCATLRQGGF